MEKEGWTYDGLAKFLRGDKDVESKADELLKTMKDKTPTKEKLYEKSAEKTSENLDEKEKKFDGNVEGLASFLRGKKDPKARTEELYKNMKHNKPIAENISMKSFENIGKNVSMEKLFIHQGDIEA